MSDVRDMFPKADPVVDMNEYRDWCEENAVTETEHDKLLQLFLYLSDRYETELWERECDLYNEYEDKLVVSEAEIAKCKEQIENLEYQIGYRDWHRMI